MYYGRKAIRGFTLIEALILVLIVTLVVIMAYPAFKKIREARQKAAGPPPATAPARP
jgi:Tfp pilus assembly protein PilE